MTQQTLDEQLATARAELTSALVSGSDTTAARYRIKQLEDHAGAQRRQSREMQASANRAEATKIELAATEHADRAHASIVAVIASPELDVLVGEPLPDEPQRDPFLDRMAHVLAVAENHLRAAEAELQPLAQRAKVLSARLDEKQVESPRFLRRPFGLSQAATGC